MPTKREMTLEERIGWLEWQVVRLKWALAGGVSILIGALVANVIVGDRYGTVVQVIAGIAAWGLAVFYLYRSEFKNHPDHIKLIDP
jgi:hypothetical protein